MCQHKEGEQVRGVSRSRGSGEGKGGLEKKTWPGQSGGRKKMWEKLVMKRASIGQQKKECAPGFDDSKKRKGPERC